MRVPVRAVAAAGHGVVIGVPSNGGPHYRGVLGTIATISREEGFRSDSGSHLLFSSFLNKICQFQHLLLNRSLYNGLNAGLQRQMCFASVRLGMYEPVKGFYQKLLKREALKIKPLMIISNFKLI